MARVLSGVQHENGSHLQAMAAAAGGGEQAPTISASTFPRGILASL
jgi:hypothetical protein